MNHTGHYRILPSIKRCHKLIGFRFGNIQLLVFTYLELQDLQKLECVARALNHGAEVDRLIKSLLESKPKELLEDIKQMILLTDRLNNTHDGLMRTLFVKRNACKIISDKLKFLLSELKMVDKLSDMQKCVIDLLPRLLRSVRNLARPDGNGLQQMVKEGLCSTVVSVIKMEILRDHGDVHEMGWAAVINLAATSFNKKSIANESGIKLLVEAGACDGLISTLKNPAFRSEWLIFENALWALVNISVDSVGEKKLLQLDSTKLVVDCMRNEHFITNAAVQEQVEPRPFVNSI